jgi:hypothetical protein
MPNTTKSETTIVHSTLPTTNLEVTVKGATKSIAVERRGDGSVAFTDKHGVKYVFQYNYELAQFFKMLAELE